MKSKMTFVLYKASYDWKCCFYLMARNSIIYDCEKITFVIFKDRRLTKMTMKTFKRKMYNTSRYSKLATAYAFEHVLNGVIRLIGELTYYAHTFRNCFCSHVSDNHIRLLLSLYCIQAPINCEGFPGNQIKINQSQRVYKSNVSV